MKSGITLKIRALDKTGTVIYDECKENDLFLWQWGVLWTQFFKIQFAASDPTVFEWRDITGATINTSSNQFYGYYSSTYGMSKARVRVGRGNTPPIITDYKLEDEIAAVVPNPPTIVTSDNIIKVLFTATFVFQEETICGEVGISVSDYIDPNANKTALITRDIFTPVTVPAGGALALQYELWFNGTPPEI